MFKQLSDGQEAQIEFILNGQAVLATEGISVAAAVLSQKLDHTRTTPVSGSKRAPFCMMGVCYDCLMVIDGKANQRACATYVRQGTRVDVQLGVGPDLEVVQ